MFDVGITQASLEIEIKELKNDLIDIWKEMLPWQPNGPYSTPQLPSSGQTIPYGITSEAHQRFVRVLSGMIDIVDNLFKGKHYELQDTTVTLNVECKRAVKDPTYAVRNALLFHLNDHAKVKRKVAHEEQPIVVYTILPGVPRARSIITSLLQPFVGYFKTVKEQVEIENNSKYMEEYFVDMDGACIDAAMRGSLDKLQGVEIDISPKFSALLDQCYENAVQNYGEVKDADDLSHPDYFYVLLEVVKLFGAPFKGDGLCNKRGKLDLSVGPEIIQGIKQLRHITPKTAPLTFLDAYQDENLTPQQQITYLQLIFQDIQFFSQFKWADQKDDSLTCSHRFDAMMQQEIKESGEVKGKAVRSVFSLAFNEWKVKDIAMAGLIEKMSGKALGEALGKEIITKEKWKNFPACFSAIAAKSETIYDRFLKADEPYDTSELIGRSLDYPIADIVSHLSRLAKIVGAKALKKDINESGILTPKFIREKLLNKDINDVIIDDVVSDLSHLAKIAHPKRLTQLIIDSGILGLLIAGKSKEDLEVLFAFFHEKWPKEQCIALLEGTNFFKNPNIAQTKPEKLIQLLKLAASSMEQKTFLAMVDGWYENALNTFEYVYRDPFPVFGEDAALPNVPNPVFYNLEEQLFALTVIYREPEEAARRLLNCTNFNHFNAGMLALQQTPNGLAILAHLFKSPRFAEKFNEFRLTADQVNAFINPLLRQAGPAAIYPALISWLNEIEGYVMRSRNFSRIQAAKNAQFQALRTARESGESVSLLEPGIPFEKQDVQGILIETQKDHDQGFWHLITRSRLVGILKKYYNPEWTWQDYLVRGLKIVVVMAYVLINVALIAGGITAIFTPFLIFTTQWAMNFICGGGVGLIALAGYGLYKYFSQPSLSHLEGNPPHNREGLQVQPTRDYAKLIYDDALVSVVKPQSGASTHHQYSVHRQYSVSPEFWCTVIDSDNGDEKWLGPPSASAVVNVNHVESMQP